MLPLSIRAHRTQSPLHDYPICNDKNASSNHRASLEKDVSTELDVCFLYICKFESGFIHKTGLQIEQLQLRLQQEKSIRMVLEKSMGRVSSTLSPGHRHFSTQVTSSLRGWIPNSNEFGATNIKDKRLFHILINIWMQKQYEVIPRCEEDFYPTIAKPVVHFNFSVQDML